MRLSKIVVGGAQIGNNYGVVGKKLSKNEIIKIFNFFQRKKWVHMLIPHLIMGTVKNY